MNLSNRMKQLRLEKKLTAKEFGNILNVSESAVSLYENDRRTPSKDLIIKMSDYFNVSSDYLLGITDIPTPSLRSDLSDSEKIDAVAAVEKILALFEKNDEIMFDGKIMNKQTKIIFKKSLVNMIETARLVSKENHNNSSNIYPTNEE